MAVKELARMTPQELGRLFPIILKAHDARYFEEYVAEEQLLREIFPADAIFRLSHIGSTAVPDLIAKPTVDLLLELREGFDPAPLLPALRDAGYHPDRHPENPPPHWSCYKGYTPEGFLEKVCHLHIRYPGDWGELYFRDYLRTHPESTAEYAALKQILAKKFHYDRDGYTAAKGNFIRRVTEIARREFSGRHNPETFRNGQLQ